MPLKLVNKMIRSWAYFSFHCIGFLDLFAVSLVIPAFPVHIKSLGASSTLIGIITSIYGALQFFSSPLVGKWSDQTSRLYVMSLCLILSASGYFLSAFVTTTLAGLALLRILPGMFKHTQDLSRCCLIEECQSSRSEALGSFNAISSIGFMIGPPLHGYFVKEFGSSNGIVISFALCSFVFIINLALVIHLRYKFVADKQNKAALNSCSNGTHAIPTYEKSRNDIKTKKSWIQTLTSLSAYHRGVFIFRFLMSLSVMMFRSSFVLWLKHYQTQLSPIMIGYILSYNGFLGLVCGFSVSKISSLWCYKGLEEKMNLHAGFLVVIAFLIILVSKEVITILVAMTILTTGTAVLRVCGLVLTAKHLEPHQMGKIQGLGSSSLSVARFTAPLICGIMQEYSFAAPNILSLLLACIAISTFYRNCYVINEEKKTQ